MITYSEAVSYIEQSGVRGSILGLDRMKCLCECLEHPEKSLKFIHIAGTNGKGSTACFIAAILQEAGYRTGLYYSPAMTGIKDHYAVNGELISDDDYSACVEQLMKANEKVFDILGEEATQFELETALAFLYFNMKKCDVVVLETGLGGRDDATNIVADKAACVFTSISLDHTAILGNTLDEIAEVKSGIITSAVPVIISESNNESPAYATIAKKCSCFGICPSLAVIEELDSVLECGDNGRYPLSLKGDFQKENAALALCTAKELIRTGYHISLENISRALQTAYWPFRFEKICDKPRIYVDGAHNPSAARALSNAIDTELAGQKIILVMGMFKDKDYETVISILAPKAEAIVALTTPDNIRALSAEMISDVARRYCGNIYTAEDLEDAAQHAFFDGKGDDTVVLACGSLSYLSLFKKSVTALTKV